MIGVQNRGPHWYIYSLDTWPPQNWQPVPDGKSGEFEDSPAQTRYRELARAREERASSQQLAAGG